MGIYRKLKKKYYNLSDYYSYMAYYFDNGFKLFFKKASRYLTRFWNEK